MADLVAVWRAAVAACDPRRVVREACAEMAASAAPAHVVAVGKAAGAMAAGALDVFGARDGLVVTVDGVDVPDVVAASGLRVRRAGHPVPDARSEAAGRELMDLMQRVRADECVLVLVSGGASALVAVPRDGIDLAAKIVVVAQAMKRGAPIAELNRVRTDLSAIKGGKLAAMCPGKVTTLVVSDVPGDDVRVVGSGPTVPGKPGDDVRLVAGMERLRREAANALPGDGGNFDNFSGVNGSAEGSEVREGTSAAGDGGNFDNFSGTERAIEAREAVLEGTADEVAEEVAGVARRLEAGRAWVAGGEWTVEVGETAGKGGRATHLALLVAKMIDGMEGVRVLVAGSDGVDGTGPWAGALVDGETWAKVGTDGERALTACDSGTVLARVGAAIVSGPTGVNHADLVIVERSGARARGGTDTRARATQGP